MPRPKRPGAPEPKRRSRHGCWPCKRRKVKCGEEKPACSNCVRQGDACDYSVRLNWEGRTKRKSIESPTPSSYSGLSIFSTGTFSQSPSMASPAPSDWQASTPFPNFVQSEWSVGTGSSPHATSSSPGNSRVLRITPVSPSSALANSPTGFDNQSQGTLDQSVPMDSPVVSVVQERVMSPDYPASLAVTDSLHRSHGFQFTDTSEHNPSFESRFNYFTPLGFEHNSISQPTSFLRETLSTADVSMQSSLPIQDDLHRAKRYKERDDGHQQHHISPTANGSGGLPATGLASRPLSQGFRRVSVNSLLSQSAETRLTLSDAKNMENRQAVISGHEVIFGFDCGDPDYDLNKNDDSEAIKPISPSEEEVFTTEALCPVSERTLMGSFRVRRRSSFTTGGGYYVTPVRVKIPRWMSPLPTTLLENPINLMYFHHFIDHTARILVPHDCDKNAFLQVLPAMAIADPILLNLMLAYSASHRARFLRHQEPSLRIAHWVRDVFPTLRYALNEPGEKVTYSHLATAIMLLSLKIVSPSTFEVPITWQTHLKLARDLFVACGVHHEAYPENREAYFLAHWFGYLDIVGSLSCRRSGAPLLQTNYWSPTSSDRAHDHEEDDDENHRVDCFSGCTPETGAHLARLGYLTNQCDSERFDEVDNFLPHWTPSQEVIQAAESLLSDMERSRQRGHAMGTHHTELENDEMIAIDQAFHWSAILHLYRRVLGKASYSTEVEEAVNHLCNAIARIRPGSSTECSVLFPLFTAGCEVRDPEQRLEIMNRVKNFEAEGLKQFKNARKLMQRCWEKDLPWIALAQGEFLG